MLLPFAIFLICFILALCFADVDMLENVEIGEQKRRDDLYQSAKRKTGIYDDKYIFLLLCFSSSYHLIQIFTSHSSLLGHFSAFYLFLNSRFSDDTGIKKPMLPQYDDPVENEVLILCFLLCAF